MRALCGVHSAVPGVAFPVDGVGRRVLVETFPPNGVVVQVVANVRENGAFLGGFQRVRVGLFVGAGRYAEEAVFGVDGVQTAVFTFADPGNVVADAPYFVALLGVNFRRDQHGQVGLAAGRRERRADVFDFALRVLQAKDQHVFSLPALVFAKVGGNAQCKALFAQQHVAAVSGVYRDDGVVFRELADPSVFRVYVALGVHAAYPVVRIAQRIQHVFADTGHDIHVQHNVNGVGDLNTDLGERRADRAHRIGDDVHRSALVRTGSDVVKHFIGFLRIHPVVGGAGVLFFSGADERAVLHTGHVVFSRSVQIAVGQQILVELDHFAGLAGLGLQCVDLFFRAVDPNDLGGLEQFDLFVEPAEHRFVFGQFFHNLMSPLQAFKKYKSIPTVCTFGINYVNKKSPAFYSLTL